MEPDRVKPIFPDNASSRHSRKLGHNHGASSVQQDLTYGTRSRGLPICKLTPLGQRGGTVLAENVASGQMARVVEAVVDRCTHRREDLQRVGCEFLFTAPIQS